MTPHRTRRKEMEDTLRAAGCRMTPQRKAIVKYLASTDSHPSARQILNEATKDCPGISLATVYNTLETLAKLGLIRIMDFQAADNRHETNISPHINLLCTICGKIDDFEDGEGLPIDRINREYGFEVYGFRMEYYGLCAQCKSKAREVPIS